uniref:ANK_REP_REGION domain-containing protein n=1 Tax=Mesocestoides corti TaxID=53468 RepID=A0A5K3FCC1_MESCO
MEGHLEVVQYLLSVSSNWVSQLEARTDMGKTPKQLAKQFQRAGVVAFLEHTEWKRRLSTKDEVDLKVPGHTAALSGDQMRLCSLVASGVVNVNEVDEDGNTLLHKAIEGNQSECIIWLLENGAGVNRRNCLNETPLDFAKRLKNVGASKILATFEEEDKAKVAKHDHHQMVSDKDNLLPDCLQPPDENASLDRALQRIVLLAKYLYRAKLDFFQFGGKEIELEKCGISEEKSVRELANELEYERGIREELEIELEQCRQQLREANYNLDTLRMQRRKELA